MNTLLNLVNNRNFVLVGKYKTDAIMERINDINNDFINGLFRNGDDIMEVVKKYLTIQEITNGKLIHLTNKMKFAPVIEYELNGKMNFINIIVLKSNLV